MTPLELEMTEKAKREYLETLPMKELVYRLSWVAKAFGAAQAMMENQVRVSAMAKDLYVYEKELLDRIDALNKE